jgi:spore germination cell wall hydrolase CwlJ-like protein
MKKIVVCVLVLALIMIQTYKVQAAPRKDYYVPWISEKFGAEVYLSQDDFKLLCHTVFCEAGNQSMEAQRLCAVTILNRIGDKSFPNSMKGVVYQGNGKQFNVVLWAGFPEAYPYTEQVEEACYLAIAMYPIEPANMLFFRSGHYFSEYTAYTSDGDMYFSVKE